MEFKKSRRLFRPLFFIACAILGALIGGGVAYAHTGYHYLSTGLHYYYDGHDHTHWTGDWWRYNTRHFINTSSDRNTVSVISTRYSAGYSSDNMLFGILWMWRDQSPYNSQEYYEFSGTWIGTLVAEHWTTEWSYDQMGTSQLTTAQDIAKLEYDGWTHMAWDYIVFDP